MTPDRARDLRLIGVTAVVTFLMPLVGSWVLFAVLARKGVPPTPRLAPPKKITVTFYPVSQWPAKALPPTEISASEFDYATRLLTPDRYYEGGVNDKITPLIAEGRITHESGPDTLLLVRDSGVNPVLISVDGQNYFYGKVYDDVGAGSVDLYRLVHRVAKGKNP
jgi:hypothetical protein